MILKKYLLKEIAKTFFLFIGGCYFLYVLIDYSIHMQILYREGIPIKDICLYYLFQFPNRADILIPLALLIATIKVLTTLNTSNEIITLISSGISIKKVVNIFLYPSMILATFLYLNFQFLQPLSSTALKKFEKYAFKKSVSQNIGILPLTENGILIYQQFESETQSFHDVYLYKNHDLIYRIQEFYPYGKNPIGKKVDVLQRIEGELQQMESFDMLIFDTIHFDKASFPNPIFLPLTQSLTELFSNFSWRLHLTSKEAEIASLFLYKIMIPLACFLVVIAPTPFCLNFGPSLKVFIIYALALFGILLFFTLVKACLILGKHQVISPLWAMLTPFVLSFAWFGWRYAKF
ncbi:MAG: LptF/LptG family permease [Chlamydiales bacterium]